MRTPPASDFQVERGGVALDRARAGSAIVTGITYGLTVPGWVSEFEIYSAMRHAGYSETSWGEIRWRARARAVAHYRLTHLVSLHEADAVASAQRRPSSA